MREELEKEHCLYIGDEIRDIEAAKKAEIKIGVVTWGYNEKQALILEQPDYVFDSPNEILDALKAIV